MGGREAAKDAVGGFIDSEALFGMIFGSQIFNKYVGELMLQTELTKASEKVHQDGGFIDVWEDIDGAPSPSSWSVSSIGFCKKTDGN